MKQVGLKAGAAAIGVALLVSFVSISSALNSAPPNPAHNPAPFEKALAPLSFMAMVHLNHVSKGMPVLDPIRLVELTAPPTGSPPVTLDSSVKLFNKDTGILPQNEPSIAVAGLNVTGGANDFRGFTTLFPGFSGFYVSLDGGATLAKEGALPGVVINGILVASGGDPVLDIDNAGHFFYTSLAFCNGVVCMQTNNGVMLARSTSSLTATPTGGATDPSRCAGSPSSNPCWTSKLLFGSSGVDTLEDKPWMAVDRSGGPFSGSVYVSWTHFKSDGTSVIFLARCINDLSACTVLNGPLNPLSGSDQFTEDSYPVVDTAGKVYVVWANFGTAFTFGPVDIRIRASGPGGASFGTIFNVASLPTPGTRSGVGPIIGLANEQLRVSTIPKLAVSGSSRVFVAYDVCAAPTAGNYYWQFLIGSTIVAPGNCNNSDVKVTFHDLPLSGTGWTTVNVNAVEAAATSTSIGVHEQQFMPTITANATKVLVAYYSTEFDSTIKRRIDVVLASSSTTGTPTWTFKRVTSVSNEPSADPGLFDYLTISGGAFFAPQYGDYFQVVTSGGTTYIHFNADYVTKRGTLQEDNFLAKLT